MTVNQYLDSFDGKRRVYKLWSVILVKLRLVHERRITNLYIVWILLHPMMFKTTGIPGGKRQHTEILIQSTLITTESLDIIDVKFASGIKNIIIIFFFFLPIHRYVLAL